MSKLSNLRLVYHVTLRTIAKTLAFLQKKGMVGHEGVVLWPGRVVENVCKGSSPIFPRQVTGPLHYRIPDDETFRIIGYIYRQGLVIPIQVHSHPREAFHSQVDDERAFVQHENAVSIVVPDYANFSAPNFLTKAHFFRLMSGNWWREMPPGEVDAIIRVDDL